MFLREDALRRFRKIAVEVGSDPHITELQRRTAG